jgi:hypothetical protein
MRRWGDANPAQRVVTAQPAASIADALGEQGLFGAAEKIEALEVSAFDRTG